jgi:hypothetical protein
MAAGVSVAPGVMELAWYEPHVDVASIAASKRATALGDSSRTPQSVSGWGDSNDLGALSSAISNSATVSASFPYGGPYRPANHCHASDEMRWPSGMSAYLYGTACV